MSEKDAQDRFEDAVERLEEAVDRIEDNDNDGTSDVVESETFDPRTDASDDMGVVSVDSDPHDDPPDRDLP